jgi:hypothetical protein
VGAGHRLRDENSDVDRAKMQCVSFETAFHDCHANVRFVVRDPDGGRFSPVAESKACPAYAPGTWRVSKETAEPSVDDPALVPHQLRATADARGTG